jgi:hypothetical protein
MSVDSLRHNGPSKRTADYGQGVIENAFCLSVLPSAAIVPVAGGQSASKGKTFRTRCLMHQPAHSETRNG